MAVNRVPVLKRCRALGLEPSYLGYDKKSRRQNARAGKKVSEYGLQLREKQKAKFIYGVLEKPFRNYYNKADRMKGMTGENLMIMLERRLDNVIFRMGFARTRREARQVVGHKHVLVNGKMVNIPSYLIKAGDVIEISEKARSLQRYKDIVEVTGGRLVPEWMDVEALLASEAIYLPDGGDIWLWSACVEGIVDRHFLYAMKNVALFHCNV
ncbi:MAG: 30S ribosomal protein S4 [Lachnospiraceae bacterium]|nr:30S ribosomal protein S4 [Lachnospiraceae bacterium]